MKRCDSLQFVLMRDGEGRGAIRESSPLLIKIQKNNNKH